MIAEWNCRSNTRSVDIGLTPHFYLISLMYYSLQQRPSQSNAWGCAIDTVTFATLRLYIIQFHHPCYLARVRRSHHCCVGSRKR